MISTCAGDRKNTKEQFSNILRDLAVGMGEREECLRRDSCLEEVKYVWLCLFADNQVSNVDKVLPKFKRDSTCNRYGHLLITCFIMNENFLFGGEQSYSRLKYRTNLKIKFKNVHIFALMQNSIWIIDMNKQRYSIITTYI